jgi:hypothetical protein
VKKQAEAELATLKAADAAAASLFKTVGAAGRPAAGGVDDRIAARASEIAKRDGVDIGEATRRTAREAPELWAEKAAEREARVAAAANGRG